MLNLIWHHKLVDSEIVLFLEHFLSPHAEFICVAVYIMVENILGIGVGFFGGWVVGGKGCAVYSISTCTSLVNLLDVL